MAYSRLASSAWPTPGGDPGVLSIHLVNSIVEADYLLKVPWNNCRIAYAYTIVTNVAVDATTNWSIGIYKTATTGTLLVDCTIPKSSAIGTVTDGTMNNTVAAGTARKNLLNTNLLCITSIGDGTTPTGECELYIYFEPSPLA